MPKPKTTYETRSRWNLEIDWNQWETDRPAIKLQQVLELPGVHTVTLHNDDSQTEWRRQDGQI